MAPITISEKEQMNISANRSTEAVIMRMIDLLEDLERRVEALENP
tara:strand:- start:22180 stop:22314 length:135 start_codon:yes stop_codon:yes gene_type:complete